ncbi:hypothetical protein QZH41_019312 [Actinostola sp. cb2023]|nr:hypothetical protein QZH41_019312 [Actinostola sp. cb2023]
MEATSQKQSPMKRLQTVSKALLVVILLQCQIPCLFWRRRRKSPSPCSPLDCAVGNWTKWGHCSTSCGLDGTQSRVREKMKCVWENALFSPPTFSISPVNQTVAMGTEVTLTCKVTGYPLPVIGWTKDGEDLGTGIAQARNITGNNTSSTPRVAVSATSSKFSFPGVAIGNSTITSHVTQPSAAHLTTNIAMVTVTPNATNDVIQPSTTVSLALNTVMTSSSTPLPPIALNTAMTSSSTPLTPIALNTAMTSSSTPLTPIALNTAMTSSSTPLSPIALNTAMTSSSTPLTPIALNTAVTSSSTPLTPIALNTAMTSSSTPLSPNDTITPSITSVQPATPIITTPPPTKRPFTGIITQRGRNSTLFLKSASMDDQAEYRCYASNALGNAKTPVSLLFVVYMRDTKPRFEVVPRNTSVFLGMNATMNCSATGIPTPDITWYKNKRLVSKGDNVSMTTIDNTLVMTIFFVSRDDEGVYMCVAKNALGVAVSSDAFLVLKGREVQPVLNMPSNTEKNGNKQKEAQSEELLDDLVYLRLMGFNRNWELPRDRLEVTNEKLGSGCFGNVYTGLYTRKDGKEMVVAVKMLKATATDDGHKDIIAELEILKQVGRHPNIVSLVGACTKDEPICIVIELVEGGCLHELLRKTRIVYERRSGYENIRSSLTDRDLVTIALDIAKGMKHLHKKQCIHRDLATRNVLIGKGLVAKIADFGLARNVPSDGLYVKTSGGRVPWKWMAPEALRGLFTNKSDIWSFGILLWEMVTLGDTPYPTTSQVILLYNRLVDGYRLEKPTQCDELLYALMSACWSAESDARPDFEEIHSRLRDILNQNNYDLSRPMASSVNPYALSFASNNGGCSESKAFDKSVDSIYSDYLFVVQ